MATTGDNGDQAAEHTDQQLADARAAYVAYGETTGGLNFRGEPMPDWAGLGDTIQRAWVAAAAAVRARAEAEATYEPVRSGPPSPPVPPRLPRRFA